MLGPRFVKLRTSSSCLLEQVFVACGDDPRPHRRAGPRPHVAGGRPARPAAARRRTDAWADVRLLGSGGHVAVAVARRRGGHRRGVAGGGRPAVGRHRGCRRARCRPGTPGARRRRVVGRDGGGARRRLRTGRHPPPGAHLGGHRAQGADPGAGARSGARARRRAGRTPRRRPGRRHAHHLPPHLARRRRRPRSPRGAPHRCRVLRATDPPAPPGDAVAARPHRRSGRRRTARSGHPGPRERPDDHRR